MMKNACAPSPCMYVCNIYIVRTCTEKIPHASTEVKSLRTWQSGTWTRPWKTARWDNVHDACLFLTGDCDSTVQSMEEHPEEAPAGLVDDTAVKSMEMPGAIHAIVL